MEDFTNRNISGAALFYAMIIISICFFLSIFFLDIFRLNNLKYSIDKDIKRSVSESIILYINDQYSTDRVANLEDIDKYFLKEFMERKLSEDIKKKYHQDIIIRGIDINITDKVFVTYKSSFFFNSLLLKNKNFEIYVNGRSKAQRFD